MDTGFVTLKMKLAKKKPSTPSNLSNSLNVSYSNKCSKLDIK
jgi:hypothetical protein